MLTATAKQDRQLKMEAAKLTGSVKASHLMEQRVANFRYQVRAIVEDKTWSEKYIEEMYPAIEAKAAQLPNRVDWMNADDRAQDMALALWLAHSEDPDFGNQTMAYQLQRGLNYHEPKQRDEATRVAKHDAMRIEAFESPEKVAALGGDHDYDAPIDFEIESEMVLTAIGDLKPEWRVAVVERYLFGKTARTVAAEQGWKYNTCLTYLAKGRKALAQSLAELAPESHEADSEPFVQGRGRMVVLPAGEAPPEGYTAPLTDQPTCKAAPGFEPYEPIVYPAEVMVGTHIGGYMTEIDWTVGSRYPEPEPKNLPEPNPMGAYLDALKAAERAEKMTKTGRYANAAPLLRSSEPAYNPWLNLGEPDLVLGESLNASMDDEGSAIVSYSLR